MKMFLAKSEEKDPKLLPLEWIETILNENKEIDILCESKENLVAILLDSLMYENVEFISNGFTLLNQVYSHKILFLSYLKDIQIIDDKKKIKIYEEVTILKKSL